MRTRLGLRQYYALQDHWREMGPPVHVSVALFMGIAKPKPPRLVWEGEETSGVAPALTGPEDFETFMRSMFPEGEVRG